MYQRVHKALFDPSKCLLTVIVPANRLVLVQEFKERLAGSSELCYEPCDVVQMPQETSDLFLGAQLRRLKDGLYLFRVHLYPFLT